MPKSSDRVRLETGIYRTHSGKLQISYYRNGLQRWKTVDCSLEEARQLRAQLYEGAGKGRIGQTAQDLKTITMISETIVPNKRNFIEALRATHGFRARSAWLTIAAIALAHARELEH